jgi:predicted metal-dependent phosphoesterase TrpH
VTTPLRTTIDLHCHTVRSDGTLEPLTLYAAMRDAGIALAAITDHDTLACVNELVRAGLGREASAAGPRILPGVEINTVADGLLDGTDIGRHGGELHVLGLGVDPDDAALTSALAAQRARRRERIETTLDVLASLGMDVRAELPRPDGGIDALGRPHAARALVAAGHAESVQDAFTRYLDRGRPAYVPRLGIGPRAAIEAIGAARGIAVLAHPFGAEAEPSLVRTLVGWGLGGLEAWYPTFDDATTGALVALAGGLGLLVTGGSDYHGDTMSYGAALTGLHVPASVGDVLLAALDGSRAR